MNILLPLALAAAIIPSQVPQGDQAVATVDGVAIKAKDVDQALWDWYSIDVIEELIFNQVVIGALKKQGITLNQKDADAFLNRLLAEAKESIPPGADVEAELKKQGLPKSRLAARAATEVGLRQLTEARFKPEKFRQVAWLMIGPKGTGPAEMEAARMNAQEALKKLETEPWAAVVRASSHDVNSAMRDGEIGWFDLAELPKNVADAMLPLAAGQHTGLTESQGVFAIYQVMAVGPPPPSDIDTVKAQFVARSLGKTFQAIKDLAKIERKG
jgi:hypothetical protein